MAVGVSRVTGRFAGASWEFFRFRRRRVALDGVNGRNEA